MWVVQRQVRKGGGYYSAVLRGGSQPRTVTVGYLNGNPDTAALTARLRRLSTEIMSDKEIHLTDTAVIGSLSASTDENALTVRLRATGDRLSPSEMAADTTRKSSRYRVVKVDDVGGDHQRHDRPVALVPTTSTTAPPSQGIVARTDEGLLTLVKYHHTIFWPARTGMVDDPSMKKPAASTIRAEENRYLHLLAGPLGGLRLADLNQWNFQAWLDSLKCGPRTKALYRAAYQAILNFAHRKGHIWTKHEFFPIFGADDEAKKEDPLTGAEVIALLNGASDPMRRFTLAIAVGEGLRPSEVLRVEHEDFKIANRTMIVRGTKTKRSADEIPLTPLVIKEHERYARWCKQNGVEMTGLVFMHHGKAVVNYKKTVKAAALRGGITRRVHQYLLRHSFATLAFLLGVPKEITRRIGRWTDASMLDDVNCRPRATDLAALAQAFDLDGG